MKTTILGIVIIVLIGVVCAQWTQIQFERDYYQSQTQDYIPTSYELQQRLADAGYYNGKIDGVLGSKTQAAIERYECDRYAAQEFARIGK